MSFFICGFAPSGNRVRHLPSTTRTVTNYPGNIRSVLSFEFESEWPRSPTEPGFLVRSPFEVHLGDTNVLTLEEQEVYTRSSNYTGPGPWSYRNVPEVRLSPTPLRILRFTGLLMFRFEYCSWTAQGPDSRNVSWRGKQKHRRETDHDQSDGYNTEGRDEVLPGTLYPRVPPGH